VVQLLLRARAKTGRAIADEDLLALVLLLGEVVERHRAQSHRIAEQRSPRPARGRKSPRFRRAGLVGGIDHAFEDIFFDAFAERRDD